MRFVLCLQMCIRDRDYIKNASEENPPVDFGPHIYDEVVRLQTSGTTGTPKGVQLNNVNEVLSAHDVIMHFPLNPTCLLYTSRCV